MGEQAEAGMVHSDYREASKVRFGILSLHRLRCRLGEGEEGVWSVLEAGWRVEA